MMDYFLKTMAMDSTTGQPNIDIINGVPNSVDRKRDTTLKYAVMKAYIDMDKSKPSTNGYKITLHDIKDSFLKNQDMVNVPEEKREKKWEEAYDKLEEDRELKSKFFIRKSQFRDYIVLTPRSAPVDKDQ